MQTAGVVRGQNVALPPGPPRYHAAIGWTDPEGRTDVDLSALLLAATGRVRSDDDMVCYNQPESSDGAVRYLGANLAGEQKESRVAVDLEALPPDVASVAFAASFDAGCFGDLAGVHLTLRDGSGGALVRFDISDLTTETALLFGELYRRDDAWRFRAIGQGWDSGLAGLAVDFGISLAEPDEQGPAADAAVERGRRPTEDPAPAETSGDQRIVEVPDDHGADAAYDLVSVIEVEQKTPSGSTADPESAVDRRDSTDTEPARPTSAARDGVRTRKLRPARRKIPALTLAADESWQAARIFSIAGVGAAAEQEKRATSALLAAMMAVRSFGRAMTARVGAPAGVLEAYLEVPFPLGERSVTPDGVLRIARGNKLWTGLVETKTGASQLRLEQVDNYLDVARDQGFDAVITLSNDIPASSGEHPIDVDKRKLKKVALHHVSWAEVLHEARMVSAHGEMDDPVQLWLLNELIRYLTHPRSGAVTFDDMGPAWVAVRESVSTGTLRASDRKTPLVVDAWARLIRHVSLEMTADMGATVSQLLPRKQATDRAVRRAVAAEQLAAMGTLDATLRVPDAAGPLSIMADLRTSQIRVSTAVGAPEEGGPQRRVTWLLRQLKTAPDGLLVEVHFGADTESTCELLGDVREKATMLLRDRSTPVQRFQLTLISPLGTKRSGVRGAFIPSVMSAVEAFYRNVLQPIRPWTPSAPKLPAGSLSGDIGPAGSDTAEPSVTGDEQSADAI